MARQLLKRWFLLFLLVLIPAGFGLGAQLGPARVEHWQNALGSLAATVLVILILFLMSVTLDNGRLRSALTRPAPVLWAGAVNLGLIPLMAWPLSQLQLMGDFAIGLLIAAAVPSTMAAASVWTRKAGGNDAVSLLVTLLTNGLCFVLTPLWLLVLLPDFGGESARLNIEAGYLMRKLVISALLPIAAGQLVRLIRPCAAAADRHKIALGVIAQACILIMVFWESIKAGPKVAAGALGGGTAAVAIVWVSCIVLHLVGMVVALAGSRAFRFPRDDRTAVAFAASQKTLPIGVYIAAHISAAGAPLCVLPMLMYHASQLFIDTAIADQFAMGTLRGDDGDEIT